MPCILILSIVKNISPVKNYLENVYRDHANDKLAYHGFHHVKDVLKAVNGYIRRLKIPKQEAHLLRIAALMHDIGIIWSYDTHELESIEFIKKNLPRFGYSKKEIEKICSMVLATRLPQTPKNELEKILCDSDLDYLGRDTFYIIGETLFTEFMEFGIVKNRHDWNALQIKFLKNHEYHTAYALKYLQPKLLGRIKELNSKL